jgi:long-chain acyl-CoA synthetase
MDWGIPEVAAIDYYGTAIKFGELRERVDEYINGFKSIGIPHDDVVTICLPVSIENILSLYALNSMGLIANNPNLLFLRQDFKTYTFDKGSKTVIILDAYLPFVVDSLESCQIERVIVTNLAYYLPEGQKHIFDDTSRLPNKLKEIFDNQPLMNYCIERVSQLKNRGISFFTMAEVIEIGKKSHQEPKTGPVDIDRDVTYSYTSGTTGAPKCIVYKEISANALVELHKGINTQDYVGERLFAVIPLTHATGERYCIYLQMARGKTIVPIPIYNKETFGEDLAKTKCNWIIAAPSFYLAGVAQGLISPDAFECITRPSSGGEPITKSNGRLIDQWLKMNGCKTRFCIAGGTAEDGSSTICSYLMDELTKSNETGHPVEPGIIAKIVDENNNEVAQGVRGYLHVSSPAAADRYYRNETATKARWYTDEQGVRWGITGDIAVINPNGSYSILGRKDDCCINRDGDFIYLFDIEYALEETDPIIEWEITAQPGTENRKYIVAQVVPKQEYIGREDEIVETLCRKYPLLDGVKVYRMFESSVVTGKRDYKKLKADRNGYYSICNEGYLFVSDYNDDKKPTVRMIRRDAIRNID